MKTKKTLPTSARQSTPLMEIRKSAYEVLRISLTEHRGRTYVDLRLWYRDESGEYQPSARSLSLYREMLPQTMQGLMLAAQATQTR